MRLWLLVVDSVIVTVVPPLARRCAVLPAFAKRAPDGSSARAEMRLLPRRRASPHERFLRSRGDAPPTRLRIVPMPRVPPLARRCALRRLNTKSTRRGSSARAEMRRAMRFSSSKCLWFLRSRGDAPEGQYLVDSTGEVPPLARRCARVRFNHDVEKIGSSARAEMRPSQMLPRGAGIWFLRSRGDAPLL